MLVTAVVFALGAFVFVPVVRADSPLDSFTADWREHATWNDGLAEYAVYESQRRIYGRMRSYEARIITNTEHADPETFTKSASGEGRRVFKFHVRQDVPTENYTYHFSTMCYVGVKDLKSLKIDMGSQEDCGATFKQVVNHAGELTWRQFSYFPDEGARSGALDPPDGLIFFDAMPLVLRGYPFDAPPAQPITLDVLPSQTSNAWSPVRLERWRVTYEGEQTLQLPYGAAPAHHLKLTFAGPSREMRPPVHLWFAKDPQRLNLLLKYESPSQTHELKSVRRWAYWE